MTRKSIALKPPTLPNWLGLHEGARVRVCTLDDELRLHAFSYLMK